MKPVILITIYHRFHELVKNVEAIYDSINQFRENPDIIVVWSNPRAGYRYIFEDLLYKGWINKVLYREKVEDEDLGGITYRESVNINFGLRYVKANYQNCYCIIQTADIRPNNLIYKHIDDTMHDNANLVCFHWVNHITLYSYHTNFLACSMDERYWPPLVGWENQDVLEYLFFKKVQYLPAILFDHNSGNRWFIHTHESENLSNIDQYFLLEESNLKLFIKGKKKNLYKKIKNWCTNLRRYICQK